MRYAAHTSVPVNRSKDEIEKILMRYGADQFVYGRDGNIAMVGFRYQRKTVKLELRLPDPKDFENTPKGRKRALEIGRKEWELACRQQWRALALIIKAKLEGIESGISTFEKEFLAFICLPDGQTVGDIAIPKINKAIEQQKMPKFLLAGTRRNDEQRD